MLLDTFPSHEQFRELLRTSTVIPVGAKILADTETPVSVLSRFAHDNPDVFLRTPVCDERCAPLLRGLAMELTLAGIESRCGLRIETVIEDEAGGMRVLPRFEDGLLRWIVDGYEAMSREEQTDA